MDAKLLFGFTIFSACVTTMWVTAAVITPPSNVTVRKGDRAAFRCETSSPDDVVEWSKFLPRPEGIAISGRVFNSSRKYQIINDTTLVINNVNASDGLPYACRAVFSEVQQHYANLVVVENLTATVTPMDSESSGDNNVTLTCVLQYGGPTKENTIYPLSADQELRLSIFLGDEDLTPDAIVEQRRSPSDLQPIHNITLSVNRAVTVDDINKEVRCRVSSLRPFYEDFFNMSLPFKYSATRVMISVGANETADTQFYSGTLLNCSADGIPPPHVTWHAVDRNPAYEIVQTAPGFSVLRLVGLGLHQWNCTASNEIGGVAQAQAFEFRNFTVIGVPPNASPSKTGSVGLGVGLGIGLGVPILVGIIVLIIFLRKRKTYSGYQKPAASKKKPPTFTKSSPNFGTGSLSPPKTEPLPSMVLPPPTNQNGLVRNTSPVHDTSRASDEAAPPKRCGRDSPGHGDLGTRTLGASGSMPRLNESFDSAAERNYNNGGNNRGVPNYAPMNSSYHSSNQGVPNQPSKDRSFNIDLSADKYPPMTTNHQNNLYSRRPLSDTDTSV